MKNKIKKLISQKTAVTFHYLRQIDGFSGDFELRNDFFNLLYWHDLSQEAVTALVDLLANEEIELVKCSPLVYIEEGDYKGKLPQLAFTSVVKRYPTMRWFPAMLRIK